MDKNIVILEGVIGDDYTYKKSIDGHEYATFTLCMNNFTKSFKDISTESDRTFSQSLIRIFVYDKNLVEYLHKVNAHLGCRASVFGKLSSTRSEYKGISYIANNVTCRDITIIKTKNDGKLQG